SEVETEQEDLGVTEPDAVTPANDAAATAEAAPEVAADQQVGPFDASQVPTAEGFVDLGAIRLPGIQGLVMSMEMDQASGDVTAVRIHLGESQLQLQAFAAPRSSGIWDEIRGEIAEALAAQGGSADEQGGPFGTELLVRMPGRGADGSSVISAMRFVGIDHPRWFLRGVISGPAAIDSAAAQPFVDLLHVTVVDRGNEPMAPRELLPLRLPQDPDTHSAESTPVDAAGEVPAGQVAAAPASIQSASGESGSQSGEGDQEPVSTDDLRPFERGPEITEIR
ncbi:MAG: DUF3710 domain-containing protein, partial [Micrococcales bacterium]|nr:DUF3710 domain-containing protein [Micrococcales bacterium]